MILVLNGPNLNLLGKREPAVYGTLTLAELNDTVKGWAKEAGFDAVCRQSNSEGQLIDWLHSARDEGARAVILNAGGYSHTSIALRDAIASIDLPVVEVHLSNVFARESFRHESMLSAVCRGTITGLGPNSYRAAIVALEGILA